MECSTTFSQGSDGQAVDPVTIAHTARDEMILPAPEMAGSPALDTEQLVGVPVWLWLEDSSWETVSAEASVPGGEVTVTARPQRSTWDMGDGSTVTCDGPGTAWDPEQFAAEEASPDCGHTYTQASSDQRDGVYAVSVEVRWVVTYAISGEDSGALDPLVTSETAQVEVGESFGVVTRS
ncbi:hypothetical protein F4561_005231 [Lipingzhangella halophila]|uniref:ATP/GTP-binding protein n=1 Tax=Lipingzhangella halophila TaxID=1783352 RepID=A0A7W7W545_9ACTN|nr:hypothetical protein [Lipingzhangella halophila]MBB4934411.1 hypothetical protein [Lipingzhangella halophila]